MSVEGSSQSEAAGPSGAFSAEGEDLRVRRRERRMRARVITSHSARMRSMEQGSTRRGPMTSMRRRVKAQ